MIPRSRSRGTAALLACAGLAAVAAAAAGRQVPSLLAGLGAALALALPSYWSLAWAVKRPDRVFFSVFAGGILFRLTGVAAAAFALRGRAGYSLPASLVTLVVALLVLSLIEAYFVHKEVDAKP
jgi:drug/metabolite transporter (DMT)-like permease